MKNKKLEEKMENIKLLGRACIFIPYFTAIYAKAVIGEEIKGAYFRTFKIPHFAYERDDMTCYIRLDKEQNKKV